MCAIAADATLLGPILLKCRSGFCSLVPKTPSSECPTKRKHAIQLRELHAVSMATVVSHPRTSAARMLQRVLVLAPGRVCISHYVSPVVAQIVAAYFLLIKQQQIQRSAADINKCISNALYRLPLVLNGRIYSARIVTLQDRDLLRACLLIYSW